MFRHGRFALITAALALSTIVAVAPAQAQGFGAEVGPIFSSFDSAREDFGNNTGWEGGIFLGGNRNGVVGVMAKLLYAEKGDDSTDLNFLEIPLLLRVNAGSNSFCVYGIGGPVFDVLLKGSLRGIDVKDQYESTDVGVQFGGGIEISRFIVEGTFTQGLKNVLKGTNGNIRDIKTHSFALLLGFRFN